MFHGGNVGGTRSNETWAYTGADWVQLSSSGPMMQNGMLVYRPTQNDLLLHGGQTGTGGNNAGETWSFDLVGGTWTQLTTATVPANSNNPAQGLFASMAYHNPLSDNVIVHAAAAATAATRPGSSTATTGPRSRPTASAAATAACTGSPR